MSLYQKSVEKKYLNDLDSQIVEEKYADYFNHFGNPIIQQNIKESKEEEYQEGFVRDLFVNILGYTLKPSPDYNLVLEKKNIDDSKKADGAIIRDEEVIAVIELKSTQTTDLDMVESQAFGYKNHHPKCTYVITSNFEKVRLYIQNAVEYQEFDLFNLTKEMFSLLYLCLSKDSILRDLPLKIKESSVLQEANVTKKLYEDYSRFRAEIFDNIVKNNPQYDQLLLFRKTQKLLDRFLFIFFAEDRLLLPPNSISEIVKQWTTLKEELDAYVPLYDRFKKYFTYMNTGFKGKKYDIYPYNGGLFLPDDVLDNIMIDDKILHEHTIKLSAYDFETDIDVNILGHIFEHSIAEIENIQAKLRGEEVEKKKTKRKKEGVYYTPKYITKYIVENTVGKLCEEKKKELGIADEDYTPHRQKATKKKLLANLDKCREWLLGITICDPACGSGAFLNQALDFLINEHHKLDELQANLLDESIVFSDIETDILERNLYGVDINDEAVEIAKLSLWLRTAKKGRKLSTLSNNIKVGNSLIDDPEVAGEKAFRWEEEFPKIFKKGGFDVVIGNPPYVSANNMAYEERTYFNKKSEYQTLKGKWDLYILFIEKSLKLIKDNGFFSFIIPYGFLNQPFGLGIRKYILNHHTLLSIVDLHDIKIFSAATVPSCIPIIRKGKQNMKHDVAILKLMKQSLEFTYSIPLERYYKTEQNMFRTENLSLFDSIIKKVKEVNYASTLEEVAYISTGAEIHGKERRDEQGNFTSGHSKFDMLFKEYKPGLKPYIEGSAIEKSKKGRYSYPKMDYYLNYEPEIMRSAKFPELFDSEKLIIRRSSGLLGILSIFDDRNFYTSEKCIIVISKSSLPQTNKDYKYNSEIDLKYILGILNSRLMDFYYKSVYGGFIDVYPNNLKSLVIPLLEKTSQEPLIVLVSKILDFNRVLKNKKSNFLSLVNDNLGIEVLSKKLKNFFEYDFKTFLTELKKIKINLSLSDQAEWKNFFEQYKSEINQLQSEIKKTDEEIDQMVYDLYGLTEEEIRIVEGAVK